MDDSSISRKGFLSKAGQLCACACAGAMMSSLQLARGEDSVPAPAEPVKKPRSEERMEFTEKWLTRFMDVLDSTVDEPTRKQIMMANGKACLLAWFKETGQNPKPVTLERFTQWVNEKVKDGSYRVEGNVIHFQYMSAAETGQASGEGACLCPLVETKPAGLSSTYCICSVGYVKQMHELYLGRPVEVELVDSVLKGGPRCQFKITVV